MNIFKQFIRSLYSPKDIAQYRFQGIGKTILYVFFLTFLSIIPSIIYFSTAIVDGMDAIQESVKTELPSFIIENGEMQADLDAPKIINKEDFTIIFDPTGTIDQKEISNSNNTIALLKNEAIILAGGQIQPFSYSMVNDFTLSNDDLENILATVNSSLAIIIPLIAVVIYIFAAGLKFIEISFLALAGLLLQKLMEVNMQYRHTWRIAAYSVTLPTVFFIVMDSLRTLVPNGAIINWFVAFIILLLVIKEIAKLEKK
ncbi:DUF1189 domain-containing protein [Cytobacillus massiliigabonensis]|uniref:DUF1189 domain-containing protein n=1 Tax=Cytobacillus massiliigabonensis TaxID=1871011 RepID=UPI000C8431FA|nr:DUF1189 domain-containing protein [Cytobacillus massiliigabonensis]